MEVHGIAEYVVCHGRVVVEEGEVRAISGMGKFVETPAHNPHVYGRLHERERANAPQKVLNIIFCMEFYCHFSLSSSA